MKHLLFMVLLQCVLLSGIADAQVVITGVRLTKNTREVTSLNLGDEDASYTLECLYTAPPGAVTYVAWELEGYEHYVYEWDASTKTVNAEVPLVTHVDTGTETTRIGPNIHFKNPDITMAGLYTCIVYHTIEEEKVNPVIYSFNLQMYYLDNTPFKMTATMSGCNVFLSYSSNFMYPKPEVTCGFWNETGSHANTGHHALGAHVIRTFGGGLIYRQRVDGIWQILMDRTLIEVKEIPRGSQPFCNVNLPIANFTHFTLLEKNIENQLIYQRIEEKGCNISFTNDSLMDVYLQGCKMNCRNECQKSSRYNPIVELNCAEHHYPYWPHNRKARHEDWLLEATCDENQHSWFEAAYKPLDMSRIPICLKSNSVNLGSNVLLLTVVFLLTTKLST